MSHKKSSLKFGLLPRLILGVVIGILVGAISHSLGSPWIIRAGATFNSLFGNFLGFCIPLIIIGYITSGIADLGSKAARMVALAAAIAYLSTVLSSTIAFFIDISVFPSFLQIGSIVTENAENAKSTMLPPFFVINMPPIMGVMSSILTSFVIGLGIAATRVESLARGAADLRVIVAKIVANVLVPFLPFHICGIFANLTYAGTVAQLMRIFAFVFAMIIAMQILILVIQYTVAGVFSKKNPLSLMRTMLPAYLSAAGTQSSAATIPVTLRCTLANGCRNETATFAIPLCANIYLIGSAVSLTSCAVAVMMLNGYEITVAKMIPFILTLGLMMVAAPGVPGGGVMAALGILESMLGFNETMLALMIALHVAQDSFGTACNATSDGAIAIIIDKIMGSTSKTADSGV